MQTLFTVLECIQAGDIAIYHTLDRNEAERVAKRFNDEHQCEICEVFDTPLIDNYGYPFSVRELPAVFPTLFASFCMTPTD